MDLSYSFPPPAFIYFSSKFKDGEAWKCLEGRSFRNLRKSPKLTDIRFCRDTDNFHFRHLRRLPFLCRFHLSIMSATSKQLVELVARRELGLNSDGITRILLFPVAGMARNKEKWTVKSSVVYNCSRQLLINWRSLISSSLYQSQYGSAWSRRSSVQTLHKWVISIVDNFYDTLISHRCNQTLSYEQK